MNIPPIGWAILAASVLLAVLADYGIVRLMLEFLRPASAYVFWAGRAGKVGALVAWVLFFNEFWYPQFLGQGVQSVPSVVSMAEWTVIIALFLAAAVSAPRNLGGKRGRNV